MRRRRRTNKQFLGLSKMKTFCAIAIALTVGSALAGDTDSFARRTSKCQENVDNMSFEFDKSNPVYKSIDEYRGKCQLHLILDPVKRTSEVRFTSDGKTILTIPGFGTSFRTDEDDHLYVAVPGGEGGIVSAYDLRDGKKLWESKLKAISVLSHSAYRSEVTMSNSSVTGPAGAVAYVLTIHGHETFGDYIEILDCETGKLLAHRQFDSVEDSKPASESKLK